jgi:hypothetical protein
MSVTPETDAAALHDGTVVSADVARKLERERDAARSLADAAMWEADRLRSKLWRACERNEAREALQQLTNHQISTKLAL